MRSGRGIPYAWTRPKGMPRGPRNATDAREVEIDYEAEARKWREMAPRFGFCQICGASVDEDNPDPALRRLHDRSCTYLPPERRKG